MEIYLKNIGKVKEARVVIEGITVIAGENDSGKSTVGKALFAMMNGFYDWKEKVAQERFKVVHSELSSYISKEFGRNRKLVSKELTQEFLELVESTSGDLEKCTSFLEEYLENEGLSSPSVECNEVKRLVAEVFLEDGLIGSELMEYLFHKEFDGQVNHIFTEEKGELTLHIGEQRYEVTFENNAIHSMPSPQGEPPEAIYVDAPFVMDELSLYLEKSSWGSVEDHRSHLMSKLVGAKEEETVLRRKVVEHELEEVLSYFEEVCPEEMSKKGRSQFYYGKQSEGKVLKVKNLSAGLKSFLILKTLLLQGQLSHGSTIIFDEPEIHLHPQWQLLFAEVLVLIAEKFHLNVLLTTHSPYFLEAMEVYTQKHGVAKDTRYYLAENQQQSSVLREVTGKLDEIYQLLAKPIQELEDLSAYEY